MNLYDFAKNLNEGNSIKFMEGRTKGELEEIIDKNLTLENFSFLNNNETEYAVFIVREIPDTFFFGGLVITDNLKKLEAEGFKDEIIENGLPVCVKERKSKTKKTYYTMEFFPEG